MVNNNYPQSLVELYLKNGYKTNIVVDKMLLASVYGEIKKCRASNYEQTIVASDVPIMGQQVGMTVFDGNGKEVYILNGSNFATFSSKIDCIVLIADNVTINKNSGEITIPKEQNHTVDLTNTLSVVSFQTSNDSGNFYALIENRDIDMIFSKIVPGVASSLKSIAVPTDTVIRAKMADYNDIGDGERTGVFYLTGTELLLPLRNFYGVTIIRAGVAVDSRGYIVGGKSL